jgi:phosphoglycolate phosphatase-like HAD superfamily hydrolase
VSQKNSIFEMNCLYFHFWLFDHCTIFNWLFSDDLWQGWETNLNEFCETVEECPGATVLVQKLAELGIPLAIATSSRAAAVAQKRLK